MPGNRERRCRLETRRRRAQATQFHTLPVHYLQRRLSVHPERLCGAAPQIHGHLGLAKPPQV
jgi:hypothetical protein